jgi:hypothetical protein
MEIWKEIPWTDGFYEVSTEGRVRSKDRTYYRSNGRPFSVRGKMLPCHWHDGYQRVRLNVPGFPKWHMVQKLVMETFVGPRPEGAVIRHLDGEQTNNALTNLTYGTNAENQADRIKHGTANIQVVERHLSDDQVVEMRVRRARGASLAELSDAYDVTKTYVCQICIGKICQHIGGPILKPQPKHAHRKLSEEDARLIVERRLAGEKIVPLAREFGIHYSYIKTLVKRYGS